MSNIIEFRTKEKNEKVVIDTKKRLSEVNSMLDCMWNTLHSGNVLNEIYADHEGKIYYSTETDDRIMEMYSLKSHFYFFIEFINKNCSVETFMNEYDKYIEGTGWDKMISLKEKVTSP